jgi:hypothetical protein
LFVATPLSGFRLPAQSRFGEGRGALHLDLSEQPAKTDFFSNLLGVSGLRNLTLEGSATRFLRRAHPDPDEMFLPPMTEGSQQKLTSN